MSSGKTSIIITGSNHSAIRPLQRVTVSQSFLRKVFVHFPLLKDRPDYRALFWHLLFGGWHDQDTHRLLLSAEVISSIEGRSAQNTRAGAYLEKFRTEVLVPNGCDMLWSGWYLKKCRQLRRLNLGSFQPILLQEQRGDWDLDGRVYLDGSRFNPKRQRQLRLAQRSEADRLPVHCDDAKSIRAYMNALPPNLFTGLLKRNFENAFEAASAIRLENVRVAQLRILAHIKSQPQPFYFPSAKGNTVRLSTSESIPNLKSNVRRALTKGWPDADLRSSQLAICGHLWGIKEVTDFLKTGDSVWGHLCDSIQLSSELRTVAKPILKEALYSICYGMQEHSVKGLAAKKFVIEKLDRHFATRLLTVPIIKAILAARTARLSEVERQGGGTDAYGVWRPITQERGARDILAEISQSWEMSLIAPAFSLASSTDEFVIGLFQHDGFSVHFSKQTDNLRVERVKRRISEAIDERAEALGITTGIEWQARPTRDDEAGRALSGSFIGISGGIYPRKDVATCQKPSCV